MRLLTRLLLLTTAVLGLGFVTLKLGRSFPRLTHVAKQDLIEMEKSIPSSVLDLGPQILFSDLTHAPNVGWSIRDPNRGAAVSVWGRGFGTERKNSYVTVNGAALDEDSDYAEWNVDSNDVFFLKRITFWLNSTCHDGPGNITVTVDGKTSREIPFNVIDGRIFFVNKDGDGEGQGTLESPWKSPNTAVKSLRPGDVLYFRQTATPYGEKYFTGRQNFYLSRKNSTDGTETMPIALVSYPAEVASIDALENGEISKLDSNFSLGRNYWTISKFRLRALVGCIALGSSNGNRGRGLRAVGNDCVGCQVFGSGTAPITTFASEIAVLGNSSHGGLTCNKLDHAIYISGNPSTNKGVELGWNYIYDNDYSAGPMIVVNHQDDRIPLGMACKRHDIHHNLIDCKEFHGRGIGVYSLSWDESRGEAEPERTYITNNIVIGAGWANSTGGAIYCNNGKVSFLNNSLVNCVGYALTAGGPNVISLVAENNIFQMAEGSDYVYIINGAKEFRLENNFYSGLQHSPKKDKSAVSSQHAELTSSLIPRARFLGNNKGRVLKEVEDDFWGTVRSLGTGYDIGACELPPK